MRRSRTHSRRAGNAPLLTLMLALLGCGDGDAGGVDAAPPGDADTDCDPVAQTGCSAGMKCGFVLEDPEEGAGFVACVADGEQPAGGYCDEAQRAGDSDDCEAGSFCYVGRCQPICSYGGEPCAAGTCARFVNLGFDLCLETCDPIAQDCPDTAGGSPQGCYLTGDGPLCAAVFGGGGTPPGGPCFFVNDCEKGAGCFDPGICVAYCDIQACPPDDTSGDWQPCLDYCAAGEVCRGISGEPYVGACTPP